MMYRIVKTGNIEVGCTDAILYIKIANNGCFVQCEQSEAIGLAYGGTAYNLFGQSNIANAEQVMVIGQDSGQRIKDLESSNADFAETTCNLLYEIDKIKLGVTE